MNAPKIRPVGDRILIQHRADREQVLGGIVIPDSAREKPQEATVIAVGTGRRDRAGRVTPFAVKVGDTVLVARHGGAEVRFGGATYTFVREDELLGVLA